MAIDLERLRYVTARYPQLQGLRLVPLAIVFLLAAAWRAGLLHLPADDTPTGAQWWFVGGLALAVILSYVIRHWYLRMFGSVGQHRGRSGALPILGTFLLGCGALALQGVMHWHLSVPIMAVGIVMFAIGVHHFRLRGHYVAAAVLLCAYALLPRMNPAPDVSAAALDAVIGIAILIAGIGDHQLIAETLQSPEAAA